MIDTRDIQKIEYTNSTRIVGMKLTYIPTGAYVEGSSEYRYRLKEQLLIELEQLIEDNDKNFRQA